VTLNVVDFTRLHDEYLENGTEHWGIVFSPPESIGVLFHGLLRMLNSVTAEVLRNQIR
jgi:hypothetical protein